MNWVNIGSGNDLSPVRAKQAISGTNDGLLSIGPLETHFSEILIEIHTFSFRKMRFKMSSAKLAPILSRVKWVNGKGTVTGYTSSCHLIKGIWWRSNVLVRKSPMLFMSELFAQPFWLSSQHAGEPEVSSCSPCSVVVIYHIALCVIGRPVYI